MVPHRRPHAHAFGCRRAVPPWFRPPSAGYRSKQERRGSGRRAREDEMSFADRAKAKAKQAAGEVTGDEQMKREGLEEERAAKEEREGRQQMASEGMSAMGGASAGATGAPSESPVSNTVHNLVQT